MAGQGSNEGSSSGITSAECSDSTVQLNIKTLDSRVYNFQLDKNMPVSLLKEKIANEIGLPVGQQRLIFRGKVLKDEHVLSEYHIENGHTLHLVERQPNQSQASGNSTAEPAGANGNAVINLLIWKEMMQPPCLLVTVLDKFHTVLFLELLMWGTKGKALFLTLHGLLGQF